MELSCNRVNLTHLPWTLSWDGCLHTVQKDMVEVQVNRRLLVCLGSWEEEER